MRCPETHSTDIQIIEICKLIKEIVLHTNSGRWKYGKALRFYMGYLGTEDNTAYLSQAILTAIQGTLDDNNNRLCRILFKCAVELNMLCHTIAAHFRTDPIHTRGLRAYAVDEVKRTNGQVSFESAVHQQRRIEPEEEWPGSY